MRRLIQGTNAEILARVARRRALNGRIAREEHAQRRKALRRHIRARCEELGIDPALLDEEASRDALTRALADGFVYTPEPEDAAAVMALRTQAAAELADTIRSERWATGDCACVVERIYHADTPDDSQTFHAQPCAAHAGMALDALHDTLEDETLRRARVHRYLHEQHTDVLCTTGPEGETVERPGVLSFAWEGQRRKRVLVVRLGAGLLSAAQRQAVVTFADATFGRKQIDGVEASLVKVV